MSTTLTSTGLPLGAQQPSQTFSPSATSSATSSSSGPTPPGSELYLFTFLTTLLLLLGVSVAIIIRSLILRRRFRRRVQEAIANGVLIPGLMTEPTNREIGEKPKMWNVWIGTPEAKLKNSETTGEEDSDMPMPDGLSSVLPISATKLASESGSRTRLQSGLMPSHIGLYANQNNAPFFHRFFPRRPRTPENPTPSSLEAQTQQTPGTGTETRGSSSISPNAITGSSTGGSELAASSSTAPPPVPPNTVQVSLLIAMPSAAQSRYEAYVAQSNPNKGAISLPLPTLHPLAGSEDKTSSGPKSSDSELEEIDPDAESTRNQNEIGLVSEEKEKVDSSVSRPHSHSPSDAEAGGHRHPHRLSESSIAKGKMPEFSLSHSHPHSHPGDHQAGVWNHLEEGEIPYMEFGVLEVVLEGTVSAVDDEKEQGSMTGSSESGSSR